jgi:hypothetical protein
LANSTFLLVGKSRPFFRNLARHNAHAPVVNYTTSIKYVNSARRQLK